MILAYHHITLKAVAMYGQLWPIIILFERNYSVSVAVIRSDPFGLCIAY